MKTRIALLMSLIALTLTLCAGWLQGAAASNSNPAVVALQRRVTTLEAQVRTLTKRQRQLDGYASARFAGDACGLVMVTDLLQSSWIAVDDAWSGAFGRTIFGIPSSLDDRGSCKAVGLTRAPGVLSYGLTSVGSAVDWLWSTSTGQPIGASAAATSRRSSNGSKETPRSAR